MLIFIWKEDAHSTRAWEKNADWEDTACFTQNSMIERAAPELRQIRVLYKLGTSGKQSDWLDRRVIII